MAHSQKIVRRNWDASQCGYLLRSDESHVVSAMTFAKDAHDHGLAFPGHRILLRGETRAKARAPWRTARRFRLIWHGNVLVKPLLSGESSRGIPDRRHAARMAASDFGRRQLTPTGCPPWVVEKVR